MCQLTNEANKIVITYTDPYRQANALAVLAQAAAVAGDHDRMRRLSTEAVKIVRTGTLPGWRRLTAELKRVMIGDYYSSIQLTDQLASLAEAAAVGDPDHAEMIARTITNSDVRAEALAALAQAAAVAGDHDRMRRLTTEANNIVSTYTDPYPTKAKVLAALAQAAAIAGDHDRMRPLLRAAEKIVFTINPYQRPKALAALAQALAAACDHDRAEEIIRSITDLDQQAQALTALAEVVDPSEACRLLGEAFAVGRWWVPLPVVARVVPLVVVRVADVVFGNERSRDTPSDPDVDPVHRRPDGH
jgi:tetratricopeptide (TPR) repeat protein